MAGREIVGTANIDVQRFLFVDVGSKTLADGSYRVKSDYVRIDNMDGTNYLLYKFSDGTNYLKLFPGKSINCRITADSIYVKTDTTGAICEFQGLVNFKDNNVDVSDVIPSDLKVRDLSAQADGTTTVFITPEPYMSGTTMSFVDTGMQAGDTLGIVTETDPDSGLIEFSEAPKLNKSVVIAYVAQRR